MNSIWKSVLQTVIAGAARQPLPAETLRRLGIEPGDDVSQNALRALAAAHLLHKAAKPLSPAPAALPEPCPRDERPVCRPGAVRILKAVLVHEHSPELLPEFFELLARSGQRLPPELLPRVFQSGIPPGPLEVLGAPGLWLARQHPDWQHYFREEATDWATGSFKGRHLLLSHIRQTAPQTGLAWLSSTWEQEPPEHKKSFLPLLRTGLSGADIPLLERAMADKDPDVRFLATRLCLLLPDSRLLHELRDLLRRHLPGATTPEALVHALQQMLPADGLFSKTSLPTMRGRGIKNLLPDALAAEHVLLKILPPDEIRQALNLSIEQLLAIFDHPGMLPGALPNLFDSLVWYQPGGWQDAVPDYFGQRPDHPFWQSPGMKEWFLSLPEPAWQKALERSVAHLPLLEAPESALVATLGNTRHRWTKPVLLAVLGYPIRSGQARHWQPPKHLLYLLNRAAYCCRPEDALAVEFPEGQLPYAWHSALMQFRSVVGLRRHMREQVV